jgi:hypothetical protein
MASGPSSPDLPICPSVVWPSLANHLASRLS